MSKILANQIANYGDNSPIEVKEGVNIPAGKPLQVAGSAGTSGQVLSTTGTQLQWVTPFDGSYTSLTNQPTIPAAQIQSDWNASGSSVAAILNKPIVPPQPSVNVATPSASGNLQYSQGSGVFTFTPPDLSGYASNANEANWNLAYSWGDHSTAGYTTTAALNAAVANSGNWDAAYSWGNHATAGYLTTYSETDPVFLASPASSITNTKVSNWDSAYSWGDHSSANYLSTSSDIEDLANVDISGGLSDQQVLKWNAANSAWEPANDLVGGAQGVALTDLSVSTAAAGTAALSYNNTNGVFTYTPPDLSGYLTAETDPVFSAHVSSGILQTNINNWNAAYSWGDHSTQGYINNFGPISNHTDVSITSATTGQLLRYDGASWANWTPTYLSAETDTLASVTARGATTTTDITTTGKIYYSNNFADLTALTAVSATTYHGMFAHVHAEAHGYFAHAGGWTQLLDTGSNLSELANVATTAPSTNDVLTWDGNNWGPATPSGGSGNTNVTISDTAPGSPSAGDLWWESDKGRLKIYYNDTDSFQWVDASPPLSPTNIDETTTNGSNRVGVTNLTSSSQANGAIEFQTDNGTSAAVRWVFTPAGHLLPTTNDAYDIGSAEYKVRDMYLADGSLHSNSGKTLSFYDGNLTWGGDDVIMLQDLKDILATCNSFGEFKDHIMGL